MVANAWRLLGYDPREHPEAPFTPPIPPEVREEFLLRPEVESLFSLDGHMWPTLFLYYPQVVKMLGPTDPALLPVDSDCDGGLWLNLARMRQRLSGGPRKAVVIAVELLAPEGISTDEFHSPLIYTDCDPPTIPEGSVVLGYDVADDGFCSCLSNCGYTQEERDSLRPEWRSRLNDFGLIQSQESALEFREISDKRVPDHAPFWVFRLHQLPEV